MLSTEAHADTEKEITSAPRSNCQGRGGSNSDHICFLTSAGRAGALRVRSGIRTEDVLRIHGSGAPLVLIQGGLGSTDLFADVMPQLSRDREVVAVDLQGHGRTADIDRPMSFQALAEEDYNWSSEVARIKAPVLLVFGDADAVRTALAVEYFELLGGGKRDGGWDGSGMSNTQLTVLPDVTHYTILQSPLLVPIVGRFLDSLPTQTRSQ